MTNSLVTTNGASVAVQRADSHDLAALSDDQFEQALARVEIRKRRLARILDSVLVKGAHYGTVPGVKKPMLLRAGADELASAFRLEVITEPDMPDLIVETSDYVSVTVRRALVDGAGRIAARTTASCTSKEKRFKRTDGGGWTYQDAREVLNDVIAMAEKRAKSRLTVSALGLAGWLSNEDEMQESIAEDEKPITPMTPEERKVLYAAAAKKGITKERFLALIHETLGRSQVGTGDDVTRVHAAIAAWVKPEPAAPAPAPVAAEGAPAAPAPADVEYHETPAPDAREVFGAGNTGPVLPGELEIAQAQAGELPLGDPPKARRRSNYEAGA